MHVFIHLPKSTANQTELDQKVAELKKYFQSLSEKILIKNLNFGFSFEISDSAFSRINWQKIKYFRKYFDLNFINHLLTTDDIKVTAFDMDNTVVSIETLDEFAKFIDAKGKNSLISNKIKKLTDASMNGKIPFIKSINARLQLLTDVHLELLNEFLQKPLPLTNGIKELISGLQNKNIQTLLISGGFYPFARKLQLELSFGEIFCNQFEVINNRLTGKYCIPLIDAKVKKQKLISYCQKNNYRTKQTLVIGDGANDYPMMVSSGYAMGYCAKPYLRDRLSKLNWQLNLAPISSILDFWQ